MCGCVSNKAETPEKTMKGRGRVSPLQDANLDPSVRIVNLNLHEDPLKRTNIPLYYRICRDSTTSSLHVTTSCFSVWKRNRRTNGYAKVIPAVLAGESKDAGRVFFFDDNLQNDGRELGKGICNLRDATTGDFVDFSEGCNGFESDKLFEHTVVYHSSQYRNVLVKANILDAISQEDYFWGIIQRYSRPGEKLVVFMDVNSTIMCNDTSAGKDMAESLLSVMFELIEVRPQNSFEMGWGSLPAPVTVDRQIPLKQLVNDLYNCNKVRPSTFWSEENCTDFLLQLSRFAPVSWISGSRASDLVGINAFREDFRMYLKSVTQEFRDTGITRSWFRCFETLRRLRHSVILNSFGTDTRKVVLATVPDERQVTQITVNFELWEDGDKNKFVEQYKHQDVPPETPASPATPPTEPRPGTFKVNPPPSTRPVICLEASSCGRMGKSPDKNPGS
mmetsp:Transcript_21526/g.64640  ORF Transcript_21526/g.64640 Transcript_21526/m.64640 type:complete len:447 (+) Transcript_21526:107-1447(+)